MWKINYFNPKTLFFHQNRISTICIICHSIKICCYMKLNRGIPKPLPSGVFSHGVPTLTRHISKTFKDIRMSVLQIVDNSLYFTKIYKSRIFFSTVRELFWKKVNFYKTINFYKLNTVKIFISTAQKSHFYAVIFDYPVKKLSKSL